MSSNNDSDEQHQVLESFPGIYSVLNRNLVVEDDDTVKNLDFVSNLDVERVIITNCPNISLDFTSDVIGFCAVQCQFKAIGNLNLPKVTFLCFETNQIVDISALSHMHCLQFAYLGVNQISDISSLKNLKIRELHLNENCIYDLSPLKDMTSLVMLNVNTNQIITVDSLKDLVNLYSLNISNNNIQSLSCFQFQIGILDYDNTEITDFGIQTQENERELIYGEI
ncbi:leucine-rich_repeat protein [Hexamita inflata]|uniref:Leucine-rich repeat protein n=1 Tax=Hexamita inflata TaxID=28002 RepID=A0AA86UUM4_9EUKA|nr:leucine-rich repeat protein [Hexamita inflata]